MLSLKPLSRGARGSVGGSGVENQDSCRGGSVARAESKKAREKPSQSSTKRAFLRNFIVISKGKLSSRRGDTSIGSNGGHDAERAATGSTVSETSLKLHTHYLPSWVDLVLLSPHLTCSSSFVR
ncbi:hypothetical protein F5B18DRAFT_619796 [Nemania serpens]|nr:hypothetical protein F5B18DRAFT_619796 [Nemania serpens]